MYLLDTDVLSDLVRNPQGRAAQVLALRGEATVATSVIVAGELRYGCARKDAPRLTERVEALLAEIAVLPLDAEVTASYGRLRAGLESAGQVIGGNDLWIAAHALRLGRVLVTGNDRDFARVPGLVVENWLRG